MPEFRVIGLKGADYYVDETVHESARAGLAAVKAALEAVPQSADPDFVELVQVIGRYAVRREIALIEVAGAAAEPVLAVAPEGAIEPPAEPATGRKRRQRASVAAEPVDAPAAAPTPAPTLHEQLTAQCMACGAAGAGPLCRGCSLLPRCAGCSLPKTADEGGYVCATSGCEHNRQRELPLPESTAAVKASCANCSDLTDGKTTATGKPVCDWCAGPGYGPPSAAPPVAAEPATPAPSAPPPDAETLKARRGDLKRAVLAWLGTQPKRRATSAAIVAWLCESNGGFAALGAEHVNELVSDVTGGDEFAHVGGLVCRQPVCSACGAYAVPGGLAPTGSATLCAPCLATAKAATPPPTPAPPKLDPCGACGMPVVAGGGVLGGKPACKECLMAFAKPAAPAYCPHCAVTASKPAIEHGPACPLRLALGATLQINGKAASAASDAELTAVVDGAKPYVFAAALAATELTTRAEPPAVTEQASADLAAVVGEPPAWRVDVTGPARETVTVTVNGKSYWQRYAGPRTASREAEWLNAQLTAGASVADKLSRFHEGAPAQ